MGVSMSAIIGMLSLPLLLLNSFSGIVGGIWLAFIGDWGSIGLAILALFIGAFSCAILLLPGLLFAAPAAVLIEKGGLLSLLGYLSSQG